MRSTVWYTVATVAILGGCGKSSHPAPPSDPTPPVSAGFTTKLEVDRADGVVADGADVATLTLSLFRAGTPAAGIRVKLAASGTSNSIAADEETDEAGKLRATLSSTKAESKVVSASALVGEAVLPLEATVEVAFVPGPPVKLGFLNPETRAAAGRPLSLRVALLDVAENVVEEATDAITLEMIAGPAGATLAGTPTQTAIAGVAPFTDLVVNRAGDFTLEASSGTLRGTLDLHASTWFGIGPDGGVGSRIAVAPSDPSMIYSQSWGGLFRSDDGARSWRSIGDDLGGGTTGWAVDPTDAFTVYVASVSAPLVKSVDGGETWVSAASGLPADHYYFSLAIDPSDPRRVLAVGAIAEWDPNEPIYLYGSDDGAESWEPIGEIPASGLSLDPNDPSVLYAYSGDWGLGTGLWRSRDRGSSWELIGAKHHHLVGFAVDPTDSRVLYAASGVVAALRSGLEAEAWDGGNGLRRSTDGGETWEFIGAGIEEGQTLFALDPRDPSVLHVLADYMIGYRSTDRGTTWTKVGDSPDQVYSLVSGGDSLYATGSAGNMVSTDEGESWELRNAGFRAGWTTALALAPGNSDRVFASLSEGTYESSDGGESWRRIETLPSIEGFAFAGDAHRTVYAGARGAVYRSDDGGNTWASRGYYPSAFSRLVTDPFDPDMIIAVANRTGVIRSTDGGATWAKFDEDLPQLEQRALLRTGADSYMVGNWLGVFAKVGGSPWTKDVAGLPEGDGRRVRSLSIADGIIFCGTEDGVFWRDFSGWVSAGLRGETVQSLAAVTSGLLYAGTRNGVFVSHDRGGEWTRIVDGLGHLDVDYLAVDSERPDVVYAGTELRGVYKTLVGAP